MAGYEKYIEKWQGVRAEYDGARLLAKIEQRWSRRFRQTELAFAGALVLVMISYVFYYNGFYAPAGNGGIVANYVFQSNSIDGDPVMNYVLTK